MDPKVICLVNRVRLLDYVTIMSYIWINRCRYNHYNRFETTMSQVPVNLEISTLKSIALSQDQLASLKSMQQLINTLRAGEIVAAKLLIEELNNQLRPVLVVNNSRVVVADDQLQNLPEKADANLLLRVVEVSSDRLVLKVEPDANVALRPTTESLPAKEGLSDRDKPIPERLIDTSKLLQLIQTINPTFSETSGVNQILQ